MAGIKDKRIAYFIAGSEPTVTEASEIASLNLRCRTANDVMVRSKLYADTYGGTTVLEDVDGVAAHSDAVPTAYSGVALAATLIDYSIKAVPAVASVSHSSGTQQLYVVACDGATSSDVHTAASGATYSSNDETKATVSADGLVTGVGAGSCTITATFKGKTSTVAITVT